MKKCPYRMQPEPSDDGHAYLWRPVLVLGKGVIRPMWERTYDFGPDDVEGLIGSIDLRLTMTNLAKKRMSKLDEILWAVLADGLGAS